MREVTSGEARIISQLLSGEGHRGQGPRYAGLPRSTYVVARRRIFQERWVYDRYVPNPALLGFERVRLQLARPYAEELHDLSVQWRSDPGAVVLWQHPNLLFGVFFDASVPSSSRASPHRRTSTDRSSPDAGGEGGSGLSHSGVEDAGRQASTVHVVQGDPRTALLPVYFDPEGAWNRLARGEGATAYPRPLGGRPDPSPARERFQQHPGFPSIVRELLSRTPSEGMEERPLHLRGTFGLPRSRRRLVELGLVERRLLLDFGRLPPVGGRKVRQVMLLHGELLLGAKVEELFRALVGEAGVNPFLFASDGASVLVGAYAEGPYLEGRGGSSEGSSDSRPGARTPPLTIFRRYLRGLDPYWADLQGLDVLLDHAYDRLDLPPARSKGSDRTEDA